MSFFTLSEALPGNLGDAADRSNNARRIDRQEEGLLIWRIGELAQRLDIFTGDEIVERLYVAIGDGI